MAKVVHKMPTNKALVERLRVDRNLRALCGWENRGQVPDESTFSRAFAEFAPPKAGSTGFTKLWSSTMWVTR